MAALFKYFVGIAVILPVVMFVMVLSAVNMGEMFVGIAAITQAPATETARWNIELLMAEPDRRNDVHGSLSPIYPATPGNEPLGKPVYTVPLQVYAAGEQGGVRAPDRQREKLVSSAEKIRQALGKRAETL
jgi:hypothetical protein